MFVGEYLPRIVEINWCIHCKFRYILNVNDKMTWWFFFSIVQFTNLTTTPFSPSKALFRFLLFSLNLKIILLLEIDELHFSNSTGVLKKLPFAPAWKSDLFLNANLVEIWNWNYFSSSAKGNFLTNSDLIQVWVLECFEMVCL